MELRDADNVGPHFVGRVGRQKHLRLPTQHFEHRLHDQRTRIAVNEGAVVLPACEGRVDEEFDSMLSSRESRHNLSGIGDKVSSRVKG